MKKALREIAGAFCLIIIILGGAVQPDGDICFPWTIGCIAVGTIGALVLDYTSHERGRRR